MIEDMQNGEVALKLHNESKRDNLLIKSQDSPFQRIGNQIGTSIKNIFGGFGNLFKKEKEPERIGRLSDLPQEHSMRSRSIQSTFLR